MKMNDQDYLTTVLELEKNMSKLILAVEMDNWEKAEMFAEAIKELLDHYLISLFYISLFRVI